MANVLTNFLVGVGVEFDKKSASSVTTAFDGIKSKALQLGAVVAGAFGAKQLTLNFAAVNDQLGKFSTTFGVLPDDVTAFGRALSHEGGTLNSFMSQLENIERMRAGLIQGDAGFIAAAGRAGIDTTDLIAAKDATEAYLSLANQFQSMSLQQRLNAAEALGLDEASIRLLSKGRAAIMEIVDAERAMRPLTQEMTKESARFNDELQDLGTTIGGVADKISIKVLPVLSDMLKGMRDLVTVTDDVVSSGIDDLFGDTPEAPAQEVSDIVAGTSGKSKLIAARHGMGTTPVPGISFAPLDFIREHTIGGTDAEADLGRIFAYLLSAVGSSTAKEALESEARVGGVTAFGRSYYQGLNKPEQIVNNIVLDGQVIERKVIEINERNNRQVIEDMTDMVER